MSTRKNIEKQKYLGMKGLVVFITLMNMFIPLSTDLYLPALPTMSSNFHASSGLTNLTLVSFFFFYALGTLFWGPMSDKYGRKKILILGSTLYAAASLCCAVSGNVYMMIAARVVQGISAGAITSVSMALIKDCFAGQQRERILAIVQSVAGLAPMIAPVLGALLLQITSWRGAFVVLTLAGTACLVFSLLYQETLAPEEKYTGTVWGSVSRLFVVAKNPSFLIPCLIFSLYNMAFMSYIAMSSYIYVDTFGLSEQMYSYFFAASAALSLLGPLIYVRFLINTNKRRFATVCFILYTVCGVVLMTVGDLSPYLFWIGFAPFALTGTITRPFSTNILLEQQSGDTGSASSLINGMATIFGSVGMIVASLWSDSIFGLGFMVCTSGVLSLAGWLLFMRSPIPCRGVKDVR